MAFLITGIFIVFDLLTGLIKAFKEKNYTSSIMREGLFHKAGSILLVSLGALADYAQDYMDLGIDVPVCGTICVYVCLMELGSIVENIGKINPKLIPEKIKPYFLKLNEEGK